MGFVKEGVFLVLKYVWNLDLIAATLPPPKILEAPLALFIASVLDVDGDSNMDWPRDPFSIGPDGFTLRETGVIKPRLRPRR